MSEHGAVLQSYNQELVKHIEHLKIQKERLTEAILKEEEEKMLLVEKVEEMNKQLTQLNASLEAKKRMRNECEKTLAEAEIGLTKIIESSQVLLSLVQREAGSMNFT